MPIAKGKRLSYKEGAELLGLTEAQFSELTTAGTIPSVPWKGGIGVFEADVQEYKNKQAGVKPIRTETDEDKFARLRDLLGRAKGMTIQVWKRLSNEGDYTYKEDVAEVLGPPELKGRYGRGVYKLIVLQDGRKVDEFSGISVDMDVDQDGFSLLDGMAAGPSRRGPFERGRAGYERAGPRDIIDAQRSLMEILDKRGGDGSNMASMMLQNAVEERKTLEKRFEREKERDDNRHEKDMERLQEEGRLKILQLDKQIELEKLKLQNETARHKEELDARANLQSQVLAKFKEMEDAFLSAQRDLETKREQAFLKKVEDLDTIAKRQEGWIDKWFEAKKETIEAESKAAKADGTESTGQQIADAVKHGIDQFGTIVKTRLQQTDEARAQNQGAQSNPGSGVPVRPELPPPGGMPLNVSPTAKGGFIPMSVLSQVYEHDAFREVLAEAKRCLERGLPAEVFASFIGSLLASAPQAALLLYILQSRTVEEFVRESKMEKPFADLFLAEKGRKFYADTVALFNPENVQLGPQGPAIVK